MALDRLVTEDGGAVHHANLWQAVERRVVSAEPVVPGGDVAELPAPTDRELGLREMGEEEGEQRRSPGPSKKSTCRSATAALRFVMTASDSGRARSIPETNPPIAGVSGATAKPRLGAFMPTISWRSARRRAVVISLHY
jgi:hypothetical protein